MCSLCLATTRFLSLITTARDRQQSITPSHFAGKLRHKPNPVQATGLVTRTMCSGREEGSPTHGKRRLAYTVHFHSGCLPTVCYASQRSYTGWRKCLAYLSQWVYPCCSYIVISTTSNKKDDALKNHPTPKL